MRQVCSEEKIASKNCHFIYKLKGFKCVHHEDEKMLNISTLRPSSLIKKKYLAHFCLIRENVNGGSFLILFVMPSKFTSS